MTPYHRQRPAYEGFFALGLVITTAVIVFAVIAAAAVGFIVTLG